MWVFSKGLCFYHSNGKKCLSWESKVVEKRLCRTGCRSFLRNDVGPRIFGVLCRRCFGGSYKGQAPRCKGMINRDPMETHILCWSFLSSLLHLACKLLIILTLSYVSKRHFAVGHRHIEHPAWANRESWDYALNSIQSPGR